MKRKIELYNRYIPENFLVTLAISEICNIKCKFCYHYPESYDIAGFNRFYHEKDKRFLRFDDFKKIFDNIDVNIDEIALSGYGEPLLNPEFIKIFEYLVKNNNGRIKRIFLPTNGILMTPDISGKIIDIIRGSDISIQVLFSINAASPEIYKDVCCEEFYYDVVENSENFILLTKKHNITSQIFSSVQMVIVRENMHETDIFLKKWKDFFESNEMDFGIEKACTCGESIVGKTVHHSIAFVMAILGNQKDSSDTFDNSLKDLQFSQKIITLDETTRLNQNHLEIKHYNLRKPCSALWRSPVIMTNGDICICTRDLLGEYSYGNLFKDKFSNIFWGQKGNNWRKKHLAGEFCFPSICFDCQGFEGLPVSNFQLEEFCTKFNSDIYYELYKNRMNNKTIYNALRLEIMEKIEEDQLKDLLNVKNNEKFIVEELISENEYSFLLHKKDNKVEFKTQKTILPCSYLFENLIVRKDGLYCGCDKILIDVSKNRKTLSKVLKGNWSKMPQTCIECLNKAILSKDYYAANINDINKFYYQFSIEKEFFERSLPDFHNLEFDEYFQNQIFSQYLESIIRVIDKYSDNTDKLKEIYYFIKESAEVNILTRLCKLFLYNMNISISGEIITKITDIYPSKYFEFCNKNIKDLMQNKKIQWDNTDSFKDSEKLSELLFYIERYAKMEDKWIWK